jgi:D-alanyl-D-alanine carboxypeptidase (penicillin-binding protein 5/6)
VIRVTTMHTTSTKPFPPPTLHNPRRRRQRRRLIAAATVLALLAVGGYAGWRSSYSGSRTVNFTAAGWPAQGQASIAVGSGAIESSPDQQPAPIASVAKVMTAYLVLRAAPLADGADGFWVTVTDADVAATRDRQRNDESVVAVRAGEVLTEREALVALLLPSANNVAIMLAQRMAGSVGAFVREMNQTARSMGMSSTTYTDPSGLDEGTRSTAADQLKLADAAMRVPTFASLVAMKQAPLPVVGTVRNTDALLGKAGFVGIKTGSDDAAGGCFMFRTRRVVGDGTVDITGVVLGQPGSDLIGAGLDAAAQLADRVAPEY